MFFLVPQVRFERTDYTFSEGAGSVSVCVQLVGGPLLTTATALVTSLSGQALGDSINKSNDECIIPFHRK